MNEARPYASLSSGLLARKGSAKPAMRPQGFGGLEDLGWNDMGYAPGERPQAALGPEHVPSSIAALTPAPKITRTAPGGAYFGGEGFEDEEAEAFEPADPVGAEEEPDFGEPVEFDAPVAEHSEADAALAESFEDEPVEAAHVEPEHFEPDHFEVDEHEPFEAVHVEPEQVEAECSDAPESFETPPVVTQQRAILEQFEPEAEPAPERRASPRAEVVPLPKRHAAPGVGAHKAAFTLRLDADRHLRLRLACAVTGHSAQQIVARALEEALAGIPEIEALASQVPAKGRAGAKK